MGEKITKEGTEALYHSDALFASGLTTPPVDSRIILPTVSLFKGLSIALPSFASPQTVASCPSVGSALLWPALHVVAFSLLALVFLVCLYHVWYSLHTTPRASL